MAITTLQEGFPNIERNRIGKQGHTYIYGIEISTLSVDTESVDEESVDKQIKTNSLNADSTA